MLEDLGQFCAKLDKFQGFEKMFKKTLRMLQKKLGDYKGIKKILKRCEITSRKLWGIFGILMV
jgi:hypothetical protein